jgi:imidazolonepropionase-like amidohydrolase
MAVTGAGSANLFGGQMTLMRTAGAKTIDNLVIKPRIAFKIALGENPKRTHGAEKHAPTTRQGNAALIRETLKRAREYKAETVFDTKLEALAPLINGKVPAHIHCHRSDDIMTAVRICKEFGIKFALVHATEIAEIIDEFAAAVEGCENFLGVILGPIICDRPKNEMLKSRIDTAKILLDRNIPYAVCTDHPIVPTQYLALSAALTMRAGVSETDAIKSITHSPAVILGIDDFGCVAEGYSADLVIAEGCFSDVTFRVSHRIVGGKLY